MKSLVKCQSFQKKSWSVLTSVQLWLEYSRLSIDKKKAWSSHYLPIIYDALSDIHIIHIDATELQYKTNT